MPEGALTEAGSVGGEAFLSHSRTRQGVHVSLPLHGICGIKALSGSDHGELNFMVPALRFAVIFIPDI